MIYQHSRYSKTPLFNRDGNIIFRQRRRFVFGMSGSQRHRFKESDRLYNLAREYYGDSQLWWVLLDANPQYRTEMDIKSGDVLAVPSYEEVMKCLR